MLWATVKKIKLDVSPTVQKKISMHTASSREEAALPSLKDSQLAKSLVGRISPPSARLWIRNAAWSQVQRQSKVAYE